MGNAACFVVGGFNTMVETSIALQSSIKHAGYTDLATLSSEGLKATCFPKETSRGTRIDHIFGNGIACMTAAGFRHIPDTGIPTHVPLECTFQARLCQQEGLRVRKPAPLPSGWVLQCKDEEKAAASTTIADVFERSELLWESSLEAEDLDSAYSCLCADAESYVALRSNNCERLPSHMRGRGHFQVAEAYSSG